jgi:hypothetical protein
MTSSWRRRVWPWVFLGHAGLVLLLTLGFLALSQAGSEGDANIGAGLVGLPLVALGLPWSLPYVTEPHAIAELSQAATVCLPALLNLALHGIVLALVGWFRRRRLRGGSALAQG